MAETTLYNMPDGKPETLRRLSDDDLIQYISTWPAGSIDRLLAERELTRRSNILADRKATIALVIAVLALAISAHGWWSSNPF